MSVDAFRLRGFLPEKDPATQFPQDSAYSRLDELGHLLPSLLLEADARDFLAAQKIPLWCSKSVPVDADKLSLMRLYYVRLGFLASGYINQVGVPACHQLPKNLAVALCDICQRLTRPPILSYDGYALYNWRRYQTSRAVQLGNIDTIQNFVHLYDEHWFILIHVEIEMLAAEILDAALTIQDQLRQPEVVDLQLARIESALVRQIAVLKRIPEKMSAELYFKTFRPYIRFFEHVTYEGVSSTAIDYRGETGAQSSIMPCLLALLHIPHRESPLLNHLLDMRQYMPLSHCQLIEQLETLPLLRDCCDRDQFDRVLENIAVFREIHYQWAQNYINDRVADPRGTGGTPYMQWLQQLIDETRAYKHHP